MISDALGLAWWMVWYQFLLLIAVSTSAVMGMLKQHSQLFGNLFAALFALQMYIAHEAAVLNRSVEGSVSSNAHWCSPELAQALTARAWLGLKVFGIFSNTVGPLSIVAVGHHCWMLDVYMLGIYLEIGAATIITVLE